MVGALVADRSQQQFLEAAAATRPDHEQVSITRAVDQDLCGSDVVDHHALDPNPVGLDAARGLVEKLLGLLASGLLGALQHVGRHGNGWVPETRHGRQLVDVDDLDGRVAISRFFDGPPQRRFRSSDPSIPTAILLIAPPSTLLAQAMAGAAAVATAYRPSPPDGRYARGRRLIAVTASDPPARTPGTAQMEDLMEPTADVPEPADEAFSDERLR